MNVIYVYRKRVETRVLAHVLFYLYICKTSDPKMQLSNFLQVRFLKMLFDTMKRVEQHYT